MKLRYLAKQDTIQIELEVPDGKTAFEAIAGMEEYFGEKSCGCCKSVNIRHDVREYTSGKYFKLVCLDCHAQLDFGQHRNGRTLFVKRWDKDEKQPLPNRGWYVYTSDQSGGNQGGGDPGQTGGTAQQGVIPF